MKISFNWLKRYLRLDEQTPEAIEQTLIRLGFEVEQVEHRGLPLDEKVVVGEIVSRKPHPNGQRLSVCQVHVGAEGQMREIVCGASNYTIGDRVPVALVGAVLRGEVTIKKAQLRGVTSEGMLCSARELGLDGDVDGLLILEQRPEVGQPLHTLFPKNQDTVFDIEVTPNRPDCLSHLGIARELAAAFGMKCQYPERSSLPGSGPLIPSVLKEVTVTDAALCPYYTAYAIRGVKVGPSPDGLRQVIESVGLRSINAIVDITNFVLLESGQPLHAFDAAKIQGQRLTVRPARKGERITTLEGKERTLTEFMLIIADESRPLALAGIMGSVDAAVEEATTDLILEAACFHAPLIRNTSRSLALSTDSSYRFERGVDPQGVDKAVQRALALIQEIAGGTVCTAPLIVGSPNEGKRLILLCPDEVRKRCGFGPENEVIRAVLESLELRVESIKTVPEEGERWQVHIPSFRTDLERPIDLVEEFLRVYGTDKIPEAAVRFAGLPQDDDPIALYTNRVVDALVAQGFHQCFHNTLRTEEESERWLGDTHKAAQLALPHPLASDRSHLRSSLLPGLLDTFKLNQHHKTGGERFFEVGHSFSVYDGKLFEGLSVGLILSQRSKEPHWLERAPYDFYTVQRIGLDLLGMAGVEAVALQPIERSSVWQQGQAAQAGAFVTQGFSVELGIVSLEKLKTLGIADIVLAVDLRFLPSFLQQPRNRSRFQPLSLFPFVRKDLALSVATDTLAGQVGEKVKNIAQKATGKAFAVESVSIFDVYQGQGIPEGRKSIALSLTFRAPNRTLSDKEVNRAFEAIQNAIAKKTSYVVRSETEFRSQESGVSSERSNNPI